ncbi:MAG: GvpL/GvpF family gas vesicle protein [Pseudomonadota bacterium]
MIYLYAVLRKDDAARVGASGIFGGAVETRTIEETTFLLEEVPGPVLQSALGEGARDDDRVLHNAALAHQAFLSEVCAKHDVLPFRFGTAIEDDAALASLVHDQSEAFCSALDTIAGHLEWGIKVTRTEDARKKQPAAAPASGADYLRALSARKQSSDQSRQKMADLCRVIAAEVSGMAKAVQALSLRSNDNTEARLLNMACLLPRGSDEALGKAINEAVSRFEDLPIRIEITGPWPPFSFAATENGPSE